MKKLIFVGLLLSNLHLFSQSTQNKNAENYLKNFQNNKRIEYKDVLRDLIENWNSVDNMVKMGEYLERNGNIYRAKQYYDKAYKISKGDKKIGVRLKNIQKRIEKLNMEIEKLKTMLDNNPRQYKPTIKLAGIYLGLSDFTNARIYSYKARDISPNNPIANLFVNTFENKLGNPTKDAIAMSSDAVFNYKNNQKKEAYELLYNALNKSISSPFVYQNFAKVLLMDGKLGPALRCLEDAHIINKKLKTVIFECAVLNFKLKKYEDAIYFLEKMLKENQDPKSLFLIGKCFDKLGDSDTSKSYFKKASELDSTLIKRIINNKYLVVRGLKIKF